MAKTKYVVVTGGNASGKSTAVKTLSAQYPYVKSCAEIAAVQVLVRDNLGAGYFYNRTQQEEGLDLTYRQVESLSKLEGIHLDESGIFMCAHQKVDGRMDLYVRYFPKFIELMKGIDSHIVWIDTPPSVSWERRKEYYSRVASEKSKELSVPQEKLMEGLQNRLFGVYYAIRNLSEELKTTFPVLRIENIRTEEQFKQRLISETRHMFI